MDGVLIIAQLALGALGVLGIASREDMPQEGMPSLWISHILRVGIALLMTYIVARIPAQKIIRISPVIYLGLLFALLLVLIPIPGFSLKEGGSQRWLNLGFFTLQPSEFMKVAVIAYLTGFFYNHLGDWEIWRPMLVIGVAVGLIVWEPDYSTAGFIFCLALGVMLAAGITLVRFLSISFAAALLAALMLFMYLDDDSYVRKRIAGFLDVLGTQEETEGVSYQAIQAQRALTQAGIFGVGIGASERPRVPESHTDMIAVAIGNTIGLLGIATLLSLYAVIISRGLKIASVLKGPSSLLAAGAAIYIGGQASLNLLVASGLFPITGIPLPLVSYGLNSLISVGIAMGFIHGAYREVTAKGINI